ncbi:hypothetical protein ACFQY0_10575 [Haloferula chungangensis]|uniref:DUF2934 domain-containing protein n=1 Tax=Haloferula chungangensis TaxID=1048331 RepID=A0ABW2L844_9BACT
MKTTAKKATTKVAAKKVAKKSTPAKALKPTSIEEIRYAAYLNSCARIAAGHPPDELGDWLAAERALGA